MGCNMSTANNNLDLDTKGVVAIMGSDEAADPMFRCVECVDQVVPEKENPSGSVDSGSTIMDGLSERSGLSDIESPLAGVLSWMGYSPPLETPCGQALNKYFPGALPGVAVHMRTLKVMLEEHGCKPENTLFGVSCCPDEINWKGSGLTTLMSEHWGNMFPLGGISGAPFSGKTGFGAFSAHVPDDGNVVVLFAPHVGISSSGEIGKHLRYGQRKLSGTCGAVVGAYNCCVGGKHLDGEFDPTDMQMQWIKKQIAPHADRIKTEENPMAALAHQSYTMVKEKIMKVVNTKFGKGKLILIGGIMINMPEPHVDHFMPLHFEVRQEGKESMDHMSTFTLPAVPAQAPANFNFERQVTPPGPHGGLASGVGSDKSNEFNMEKMRSRAEETLAEQSVFSWLSWSPQVDTPLAATLRRHFPGALPSHAVHERVRYELEQSFALNPQNTILGLSICPDEINYGKQDLAALMRGHWGNMFPLGGISGAPFAGKTGYGAFAAHVPENGNIIVVFGPHVGITEAGEIGQYLRDGQKKCSTACGAVIGAYKACLHSAPNPDYDESDMQMDWIKKQLQPYVCQICEDENPMAALAHQSYQMVKDKVQTVVNTNLHSGYVVLIGGIQINMPKPLDDHFMPLMFEVHTRGALASDLMSSLKCPYA